jgi:spermidine synthase
VALAAAGNKIEKSLKRCGFYDLSVGLRRQRQGRGVSLTSPVDETLIASGPGFAQQVTWPIEGCCTIMTTCSSSGDFSKRARRITAGVLTVIGLVVCVVLFAQVAGDFRRVGTIEHEVTSDFSHIRVRRTGEIRTLVFVEDSGEELIESQVDLERPHRLLLPYTRSMFASYLFVPEPQRALVVGLGGGGMVHFLKHFDTDLRLDVLEIDPVVVAIADEYFQARSEANVRIVNQDARDFLQQGSEAYDVIYMDAFLGASEATDPTGIPSHLKTLPFYEQLKARLSPEGRVVFNLHRHGNHDEDVAAIRAGFAQVYLFRVPTRGNVVVAASMAETRLDQPTLRRRAAELDRDSRAEFPFQELVDNLNLVD